MTRFLLTLLRLEAIEVGHCLALGFLKGRRVLRVPALQIGFPRLVLLLDAGALALGLAEALPVFRYQAVYRGLVRRRRRVRLLLEGLRLPRGLGLEPVLVGAKPLVLLVGAQARALKALSLRLEGRRHLGRELIFPLFYGQGGLGPQALALCARVVELLPKSDDLLVLLADLGRRFLPQGLDDLVLGALDSPCAR